MDGIDQEAIGQQQITVMSNAMMGISLSVRNENMETLTIMMDVAQHDKSKLAGPLV